MRWPIGISLALLVGCAPRATMCTASFECGKASACVAGRCQLDTPTMKPAVDTARRIVVRPIDLAYVSRGDAPNDGPLPPVVALGRRDGRLLLRFDLGLPRSTTITEAYVVLHRASAVDDDPALISLHATRIVQGWTGGSVSYALQPRATELRLPTTLVEPGGASLVRVNVLDLVRKWSTRDPIDQGVAIVADGSSITGSTFALSAVGVDDHSTVEVGPYLEAYVR